MADVEEVALPLDGRKKGLTSRAWLRYYAKERLELTDKVLEDVLAGFRRVLTAWHETLMISFLPEAQKSLYQDLLSERCLRLGLG